MADEVADGFAAHVVEVHSELEVWQTTAQFKKHRPATIIHALVQPEHTDQVEAIFFKHSSTLGVRRTNWQRSKLPRESIEFESRLGTVRIKRATLPDGSTRSKIEHDDLARIAHASSQSIETIQQQILREFTQV